MKRTFTLVQKHKSRGIMTWFIRECIDGKESFHSTGTKKRSEAQKLFGEYIASINDKKAATASTVTVNEAFDGWLSSIAIAHGRGKTLNAYKSRIERAKDFCKERRITYISQLTPAEAQLFTGRMSELYAPKTVHELTKTFKTAMIWAADVNDFTIKDPFKRAALPKLKKTRVEFWTMEQIQQILSFAPDDYWRAFWGLMAFAGLRFEEARVIRIENIKNNFLTVVEGKMGKTEDLPISSKLQAMLNNVIGERKFGRLFDGHIPVRSDKCLTQLRMTIATSRIENPGMITHHKLRHSFASELLRHKVNPETVKELMRHSSIDTLFEYYAHDIRSDLVKAVEEI